MQLHPVVRSLQTAMDRVPKSAWHVIIGVFIGDFIASFVHFLEDNYIRYHPHNPGFINNIAISNELHHHFPRLMTGISYWENMQESALGFAAFAILMFLFARKTFLRYWIVIFAAGAIISTANLIHRFQHHRDCNRPVLITALMNMGIIQGREEHRAHHLGIPDNKYSVSLSFTNHIYDTLQIWNILKVVLMLIGFKPCMVSSNIWVEDTQICPQPLFRKTGSRKPRAGDVDITELHKKMYAKLRQIRETHRCAYYTAAPHDHLDHRCSGNSPEFCLDKDIDPGYNMVDFEREYLVKDDEELIRSCSLEEC